MEPMEKENDKGSQSAGKPAVPRSIRARNDLSPGTRLSVTPDDSSPLMSDYRNRREYVSGRGLVYGVLLGAAMWAVILTLIWWVFS